MKTIKQLQDEINDRLQQFVGLEFTEPKTSSEICRDAIQKILSENNISKMDANMYGIQARYPSPICSVFIAKTDIKVECDSHYIYNLERSTEGKILSAKIEFDEDILGLTIEEALNSVLNKEKTSLITKDQSFIKELSDKIERINSRIETIRRIDIE